MGEPSELTLEQIDRFKFLCKQLDFTVQVIKNDENKKALIISLPSAKYTALASLPNTKDNPYAEEMMKIGKQIEGCEMECDKVGVVGYPIPYNLYDEIKKGVENGS